MLKHFVEVAVIRVHIVFLVSPEVFLLEKHTGQTENSLHGVCIGSQVLFQPMCQCVQAVSAGFRIKIGIAEFHDQQHSGFQIDILSFSCQLAEFLAQFFRKNRANHLLCLNTERSFFTADRYFQEGQGIFSQFDQLGANLIPDKLVPVGQQLNQI